MIGFCEQHIKELRERLDEIYTIVEEGESINLVREIEKLKNMENIYSAIENGAAQGDTYEKYNGYLLLVREDLARYIEKREEIIKDNSVETTNIDLLLKSFETNLRQFKK